MATTEERADNVARVQEQMALLTTLSDRIKFARRGGIQYEGNRDIYQVAGYPADGTVEFDHLWSRYLRQDLAGEVVDKFPRTTWKDRPIIREPDMDPDNPTQFVQDFDGLAERLDLFHRFQRADRMARIGQYGILVIGVAEPGTDADLEQPMGRLKGPEDVLYVQPYHQGDLLIEQWDQDPTSSRFGLPNLYQVNPQATSEDFPIAAFQVHHSRVIHIAEDLLSDDVYGRPILLRVLNRLMDLEKVTAATGESFWQLATKILTAKLDPDAQIDDETLDEMGEALEEIIHDLRRQFLGQGAELQWMGGETPDPTGAADLPITLIAAATGYPKRVLIGNETGERASQEDVKTYLGSVQERREQFAEPVILRAFIDRLLEHGGLTPPGEDGYEVEWPNLFEVPEKEEAEADNIRADTAKKLTPVGGDPSRLVSIDDEGRVHLRKVEEEESSTDIHEEEGDGLTPPDEEGGPNRMDNGPPEADEPVPPEPEA